MLSYISKVTSFFKPKWKEKIVKKSGHWESFSFNLQNSYKKIQKKKSSEKLENPPKNFYIRSLNLSIKKKERRKKKHKKILMYCNLYLKPMENERKTKIKTKKKVFWKNENYEKFLTKFLNLFSELLWRFTDIKVSTVDEIFILIT